MQAQSATGAYRDSLRKSVGLVLWTLAWAATLALAKFGTGNVWDSRQTAATWAAVGINLVVGVGWIVAFTGFIRGLDELQRKIIHNALAVTLGVGWVVGFAYVVADSARLVTYDVDIAVFPAFLGVVYVIAFVVGNIRYR